MIDADKTAPMTYIAGPMTGYADFNRAAFREMADKLRQQGYLVHSPHEVAENTDSHPWAECLKQDIKLLLQCQQVVLLPAWSSSRGATLEALLAKALGMDIVRVQDDMLVPVTFDVLDMAWLFVRAWGKLPWA